MFKMTIDTGNAIFEDDPGELARLLRKVSDRLERGDDSGRIVEYNGNACGTFEHIKDGAE